MLEGLQAIVAAWRAILHVSEWSGLSIGALAACGALFYFIPLARKLAIAGAIAVLIAWICLMHGHAVGVADEDAKLKTISDQNDAAAAAQASAMETALVNEIEAKAKEQHAQDLAEIARLSPDCGFDPGTDDGGMHASAGSTAGNSVRRQANPAGSSAAADKGSSEAKARHGLHLPLVWRGWMQGKEHDSHAPADGKR